MLFIFLLKIKRDSEMPYNVCFENAADKLPRKFPLKYLAYAEPSPVQFAVGARVIAQYVGDENEHLEPLAYYAGIVGEEAKFLNQERYLVFFDQGYVQYCRHEQVSEFFLKISYAVCYYYLYYIFLKL
jgi:histone-lysine N-methyltransferase SETDB1